jgi:hypothetical protein
LVRERDFGAVVPGLGSVISSKYHVHITHVLSAGENCNKTTIFEVKDSKNHYFSEIFKKKPVHPLTVTKKYADCIYSIV